MAVTEEVRTVPESKGTRRWRFGWLNLIIAVLLLGGLTLVTYPTAASWVSQRNQSNVVFDQTRANSEIAREEIAQAFEKAHEYNEALVSGAFLAPGANIAEGTGGSLPGMVDPHEYWKLLNADPTGTMARLRVPSIDLDLPVYHGTSDATLLKGVGHLQGTSLPTGGEGTRSVLTGHRGLANATMFTNLDRVKKGDTFSVEVLGEVFTYRVFDLKVVAPEDTEEIRAVPGKDLMTLITCTPLGVNTHRILVTGERVTPTPAGDLESAGKKPEVPGFPWWLVGYGAGLGVVGLWVWRSGYMPKRARPVPDTLE
ncbi:class C sortase [Leucobacter sp. 7(1)]|uniref:class C sortase n=1 Tax=Leucobacter sp. 7(1) TaxID=1255613 RepID=UPI000B3624E6|nr:class C sortase [Leucobacter sp. 7(1)]